MADNIAITAGSGTTVSTEEITTLNGGAVSAQHIQRVLPATRTADGTAIDEAAGSGTISSATKRITIATDDTLVTNSTSIKTAIEIIDDWDETDRAKVNLIVGQAGIAGGTGVDGATVPRVTLATDIGLPAGTSLLGKVSASNETATIYSGATALTPKFAFANVAASQTDSNIVSAVASKKIRVISFRLHTGGTATNVTFNSKPAGAGTAISELFACAANGGRAEAFSPVGHFQSTSGEGLTVTTGSGSTTGIGVVYVEV